MNQISWEAVGVVLSVVGAWSALLLGVIRWFLNGYFKSINERFDLLSQALTGHAKEIHRIDKDVLTLRTEMHAEFVRREDAIRQEVVINAKLDSLAAKLENLTLRSRNGN